MINSGLSGAQEIITAEIVFFDFDGVIKESAAIKAEGFRLLFQDQGIELSSRIIAHHLTHQGLPRNEKIQLYLSWIDKSPTNELVNEWCAKFSKLVFFETLNSPWVPGVLDYLMNNCSRQKFIVVSAMPQDELDSLMHDLEIKNYFVSACGYPLSKKNAVADSLNRFEVTADRAIFIGDAEADREAALANLVPFILRKTSLNTDFQKKYRGKLISDFLDLTNIG